MDFLEAITSNGRVKILPESEDKMSEHTKGALKLSRTLNFSGTYTIWIKYNGKRIFSIRENSDNITLAQFEANALHLVKCWNSHDELLAACDEGLHECERVKYCSCPDKDLGGLLRRIERIEAAIANAEKT